MRNTYQCNRPLISVLFLGRGKWDAHTYSRKCARLLLFLHSCKRVVQVALEVGREDDDPLVVLDPLRQVADIHVDIPVVGTPHTALTAKQPVVFVEDRLGCFSVSPMY